MIWRGPTRLTTLAWVALAAALVATGASASTRLCKALSARIAKLPASDADKDGPIERMARQPRPIVEVSENRYVTFNSEPEVAAYKVEAAKRLPETPLVTEMFEYLSTGSGVAFHHLKSNPVQAFETISGSIGCAQFQFFTDDKSPTPVNPAPQYAAFLGTDEEPQCFTMGEHGLIGAINYAPVFITEYKNLKNYDYEISVTAWSGHGWERPCAMETFYKPIDTIGTINCEPNICQPLKPLALQLTTAMRKYEKSGDPKPFAWKTPTRSSSATDAFRRQVQALDRSTIPEPHLSVIENMASTSDVFPARLAGQDYMAVMGHSGHGDWAEPGFSLTLFESRNGEPHAVASVLIESHRGALIVNRYGRWRSTWGSLNPHKRALF